MKRVYITLISIILFGLNFQSCTKEDDILDDGEARDAFIGEWSVKDACGKQTYRSTISADEENTSRVVISNYANLGISANAVIAGSSIYIESQEIENEYRVSGNGRLHGEIITWTSHNFETTGNLNECTATYTLIE